MEENWTETTYYIRYGNHTFGYYPRDKKFFPTKTFP
jgi:hypothetical protein